MRAITKAIIPAAGLGTRFLPQTKAMPKEMLPILDKPIIQLVVEELVEAGVTDIIIVTGAQKRAIEDHFDRTVELEQALIAKGKEQAAKNIKNIAEQANFVYVRQKGEPLGNARPVINASHLIGDEPFFVLFPDDFFISRNGLGSRAQQLLEAYNEYQSPVLSLFEVAESEVSKYGIVETGKKLSDTCVEVKRLVEKPEQADAPSTLASVGGYILTPELLPIIDNLKPGKGGEIVLADALQEYAKEGRVVGRILESEYFDGGNKLGYLKAVMTAAFEHPEFAESIKEYVKERYFKS